MIFVYLILGFFIFLFISLYFFLKALARMEDEWDNENEHYHII